MKKPNAYVSFSLPSKSAGGYHTFKTAKHLLETHGIKDVEPCDPKENGHFALQVKRRYKKKANSLLNAMPNDEYLAALETLGLTVAGKPTAKALGLSVRQCQRMASGEVLVPGSVEKLLLMYVKHGLDE